MITERLLVESEDGTHVDEYRVKNHRHVEFRARGGGRQRQWKELTPDDILLHLALHTVVGKWLTMRLPTVVAGHTS